MQLLRYALWASCLALASIIASCGAGGGLDETPAADSTAPISEPLVALDSDAGVEDANREVSFTPGLPCPLPGGFSAPNILRYGWRGGLVSEGAFPNWVKLTNAIGAKPGWIQYQFNEVAIGRLQNLRFFGAGNGMRIELYNFNTASWVNFGVHNLSAGPVNIPVGLPFAPNGISRVRLTETAVGSTTRIDRIEAWVL